MRKEAAAIDGLYGRLELYLYADATTPGRVEDMEEWKNAHCLTLTRMFANHGVRFEMAVLGARTTTEIEGKLKEILWIWDNRKTKATKEGKSVQEAMKAVFKVVRNCVSGKI
jgi:hypothetical protein